MTLYDIRVKLCGGKWDRKPRRGKALLKCSVIKEHVHISFKQVTEGIEIICGTDSIILLRRTVQH